MQQLAQDQQDRLAAMDAINTAQSKTIANQAAALATAKQANDSTQATAADLTVQVQKQQQALTAAEWSKWKAMLFGYPTALAFGALIGMFILPIIKLGFSAGLKAVTGI